MNLTTYPDKSVVRTALDEIIHAHGFWPVLKALAARGLRRKPMTLPETTLSDHLRRDIGLPPVAAGNRWPVSRL
jgi:hypothetical protein